MWTALALLAVTLLICVALFSWVLTLLGLPGNWLIVAACGLYAGLIPASWRFELGWPWVLGLLALAAVGEALEFLAGAVGTQRAGGSRRSAVGALVGSLVGGIGGAVFALPIPVIGPLLGAILFGGVGAAVGALLAELSGGSHASKSWRVGWAAFWGRLIGTGAKTLVGCVMVAALVAALLI